MNWVGDVKSIIEPFTSFIISITGLGAMYWGGKKIAATIRQREKKADVIVDRGFYEQYLRDSDDMKREIRDVRAQQAKETSELRAEQARERAQWAIEKLELHAKIDELTKQSTSKDITIAELRGEVRVLRASVGQVKTAMDESDQHYNSGSV